MSARHAIARPGAVLLDLDGTLSDNFDGISRSILHALAALGASEPSHEALMSCMGPPLRASFAHLLGTDDKARIEQAIAHYRERYAAIGWQENALYAGVAETLATLKAGGETLYLCTSKPRLYAERIVDHFGVRHFLDEVYGTDLTGTLDDKATLLAHLVLREGLDPRACVMIGDRVHDVRAAHANGARALGVLWGYGDRDELADADAIVESPHAIPVALDALRRRAN